MRYDPTYMMPTSNPYYSQPPMFGGGWGGPQRVNYASANFDDLDPQKRRKDPLQAMQEAQLLDYASIPMGSRMPNDYTRGLNQGMPYNRMWGQGQYPSYAGGEAGSPYDSLRAQERMNVSAAQRQEQSAQSQYQRQLDQMMRQAGIDRQSASDRNLAQYGFAYPGAQQPQPYWR